MVTLLTLDVILDEVKARGLTIEVINGVPRLRGPKSEITSTLLDVLRARRDEVIARLAPAQVADGQAVCPREWLWADGMLYVADMRSFLAMDMGYHPRSAGWWRWAGEGEESWRELPPGAGKRMPQVEHRRKETWARMEDV